MKTVGVVATIVFLAAMSGAVALTVRSIPEIRRYMKIREM